MESNGLTQQLIQYSESKKGIRDFLISYLKARDFNIQIGIGKSAPEDIYATRGSRGKHLLLSGYYDVLVPKSKEWRIPPFSGKSDSDMIYGRGATSLGSLACALNALDEILQQKSLPHISFFLSGKGAHALNTVNNTTLQILFNKISPVDLCLSVTPQASKELGEKISTGAKGCVVFQIKSFGVSGNPSSQSERANPLHNMVDFLFKVKTYPLDSGNEKFGSSTLQILSLESNYSKEDELPEIATATIGVYYNSSHTKEEIVEWMRKNMVFSRGQFEMAYKYGAESYLCEKLRAVEQLQEASEKVLGTTPQIGGDSHPNFAWRISHYCPLISYGLPATKMHCCDEAVSQKDIKNLTQIYREFLNLYFN